MDIDPNIRPPIPGATWIYLSKGLWALVDEWLVEGMPKFYAGTRDDQDTWYGQRTETWGNKTFTLSLHRWVWVQYNGPLPKMIDHISRNGWDCRRENLRMATGVQNQGNHSLAKNNTSGFKGVWWDKRKNRWHADISINNKKKTIGIFKEKIDAAKAYDKAAKEHFGEFAWLNFPDF